MIGEVQRLATGNAFPFNAIDFRANTTGNQGNKNPAFPTFSQVNFLGSYPQVVAPHDGRGDVKALYIRERSEANSASLTDPLPPMTQVGMVITEKVLILGAVALTTSFSMIYLATRLYPLMISAI